MPNLHFFNPGRDIVETKISPHARTLRTNFKQKLKDAFFVVAGSANILGRFYQKKLNKFNYENDYEVRKHIGLLDIVTLGVFQMIDSLALLVWGSQNFLIKLGLGFIFGIIAIPLAIVRGLIAAVIVFNPLSLIVIGAVHWLSQDVFGGAELNEKIKRFLLYKNPNAEENNKETCPNTHSVTREEFWPTYSLGTGLPHFVKQENRIIGLEIRTRCFRFYAPLFSHQGVDENEIEKVRAAFKLNLARITGQMEEYVSRNGDSTDRDMPQNCQDCRDVLNLIGPHLA